MAIPVQERIVSPESQELQIAVARLVLEDGQVYDAESGEPFDADLYSYYKYGCGAATDAIALSLTDKLVAEQAAALDRGEPDPLADFYITSSAYKHVPTAAYHVTKRMVGELTAQGVTPAGLVRIDRGVVKSADYSAMTAAERERYIADNNVHIPRVSVKDVTDKTVVVVDDIRNTGGNERSFASALREQNVGRMIFCYAAIIDKELAATYPRIESDLNQAYVKGLHELSTLANRDDFEVNARICRFLMDRSYQDGELAAFVGSIPYPTARSILSAIVMDGYHSLPEYADNFTTFRKAFTAQRIGKMAKFALA